MVRSRLAKLSNWKGCLPLAEERADLIPYHATRMVANDAFGVQQYENFLVHRWNHVLPQIKTMLRRGAKIVMTSRDYIYNNARNDLKESAFPLLRESQVVIHVHDLSLEEIRQ